MDASVGLGGQLSRLAAIRAHTLAPPLVGTQRFGAQKLHCISTAYYIEIHAQDQCNGPFVVDEYTAWYILYPRLHDSR